LLFGWFLSCIMPNRSPLIRDPTDQGESDDTSDFFPKFLKATVRNFRFLGSGVLSLIAPIINLLLLFGWFLLFFGLFFVGIFAKLLDKLDTKKLLRQFSKKFAKGETMVQWTNASLYDNKNETDFKELENASYSPDFELKIAKSLLLFSGLVYEDAKFIDGKAKAWHWEREDAIYGPDKSATVQIFKSFSHDKKSSVNSGPSKSGTIVVAFRGTNPIDVSEWLVDINLLRTDGRPYLSGEVHEGFLNRLFEPHRPHKVQQESKQPKPESTYFAVIKKLNLIAEQVKSDKSVELPLNLWVTGHSLGAALATLFYARLCAEDDLNGIRLAGAYTFGCPRAGNYDFAMNTLTKENKITQERSHRRSLWRVVNANDIFPRVPIGLGLLPNAIRHKFSDGLLDYCHFGKRVQLHYSDPPRVESDDDSFVIHPSLKDYFWHYTFFSRIFKAIKDKEWAMVLSWFLPFFVADHAPALYFKNLR